MAIIFSEPDVERLLSYAMIKISCSGDHNCSQEKLLAALTRELNRAIKEKLAA